MFAPVHELARHIQVINTYNREAEYLKDPLHLVLWEVLDDLVELHAKIAPVSLFSGWFLDLIQCKFLEIAAFSCEIFLDNNHAVSV